MDYTSRIGDSAGKIAQLFTGSPMNAPDLVRANPQKGSAQGGFTFDTLLPGERLTLPASWLRGNKGGPVASGVGAPRAGGRPEYPGAFGPKYGGSGGVFENTWENPDQSLYPATGGASVYGQYYVTSEGNLTLGALILTANRGIQPGDLQNAALSNANPRLQGVDPNASLPAGTRVNVPERWVDSLKQAGYSVGNNMGVGQVPAAVNGAAAPVSNGAAGQAATVAAASNPPSPILPVVVPPGGSTPILCPDGTIAPDNDPRGCGTKAPLAADAHVETPAVIVCSDGMPAPYGDTSLCPPPSAAKAAWNQNKYGKWSYEDPAYPGWIYPLEKNTWVYRLPTPGLPPMNIPHGLGYLAAPAPPAPVATPAHPAAPPPPAPHAAPPPPVAHPAAPAPPVAHPAAPVVEGRPAPPQVQPHVTTGYVQSPSGHSWYRDARYPGYAYYENQWVPEAQLEQYAFASGGAVQADTASLQYGGGYGAPASTGWVPGPQGSWRYFDPRYPGYGYDWGQKRWMRHDELVRHYGG